MDFIKNAFKKVANFAFLDPLESAIRSFAESRVTSWREETLDTMPRKLPEMLRDSDDPDPTDDGFFEKIRDSAFGKVADVLERNLEELIKWVRADFGDELNEQTRDVSDKVTDATMKALREQLHLVPTDSEQAEEQKHRAFNPDADDSETVVDEEGEDIQQKQDRALFNTPKDDHVLHVEQRVRKYLRPRLDDVEAKLIEIYPKLFKQAAMKYFSDDGERAFDPDDPEGSQDRGLGDLFNKFTASVATTTPNFMESLINGALRVLKNPMDKLVRHQVKDLENDMAKGAAEKARHFLDKVPGMK